MMLFLLSQSTKKLLLTIVSIRNFSITGYLKYVMSYKFDREVSSWANWILEPFSSALSIHSFKHLPQKILIITISSKLWSLETWNSLYILPVYCNGQTKSLVGISRSNRLSIILRTIFCDHDISRIAWFKYLKFKTEIVHGLNLIHEN